MISYELAKALKDAGFPQDGEGFRYCDECPEHEIHFLDHGLVYVLAPTLSELIAACGEDFKILTRDKGLLSDLTNLPWAAVATEEIFGLGPTPEEAVAALYLSIHEKKQPEA